MRNISKEYLILFNSITEAAETLLALRDQLISVQQLAEEVYIGQDD